eukprot:TRINITY_DN119126_c0_g1_i1.p1 TRINITY_DN119126_c0_g1~~TRINITY_DN119126_c0_g1_i1.p1  ORF type:complete len:150 (+),score=35.73 TRINITY_DN119126_c0_g1_i1:38-487(+)
MAPADFQESGSDGATSSKDDLALKDDLKDFTVAAKTAQDDLRELTNQALNVAERRRSAIERLAETRKKVRDLGVALDALEVHTQQTPFLSAPKDVREEVQDSQDSTSDPRQKSDTNTPSLAGDRIAKRAPLPKLRGRYPSRSESANLSA